MPPIDDQKKGNVLLVANYDSDIGYAWWLMESFWSALASHFEKFHQSSFLIFPRLRTLSSRILSSPIVSAELDFSDRSRAGIRKLRHFIKEHNIKVVYLTDRAYLDTLYARMRLWGVRRIILHDHTPGERPAPAFPKRIAKKLAHRIRIFSCDHYIGVSRFVSDRLVHNVCIPEKHCSFIHNGIVPISRADSNPHYAHNAFQLPDDARIVVTTGRATTYKGLDFFIECAERLVTMQGHKECYFLHCGDGPDLALFKKMARDRGLDSHVIFAGRRNDVREILPSCAIAIQASMGEAFSLSVLEYMSAGLATLAPNNCGHGEVIKNAVSGYLYPPRDVDSVVRLIEGLLEDPRLLHRIGDNAARLVQEQFTLDRAVEQLISVVVRISETR